MAGTGCLEFRDDPVMALAPGDAVYIPADTFTRVVPATECVQIRLKVEPQVAERVAWFCEPCHTLVHEVAIADPIVQRGYLAAVTAFNAASRACPRCGAVHPAADLGDIAWARVVAALS